MAWDGQGRSARYRTRAGNAASRAKQFKSKVPKSDIYKQLHDAALAEFNVFSGLSDRALLTTPAQLLATLQAMKAAAPGGAVEAYNSEAFEQARLKEIDLLIKRIQLELT
jgi:hypothetical protein